MEYKKVSSDIGSASGVMLMAPIHLNGNNSYTIGTNTLGLDDAITYSLSELAVTFGQVVQGKDGSPTAFRCGESSVGIFDFALLSSCFTAMKVSQTENATTVFTEEFPTSRAGFYTVWFGNNGVLYNLKQHIIIPLFSASIQRSCKMQKELVSNFLGTDKYILSREGHTMHIDTEERLHVCTFKIPTFTIRSFPKLFEVVEKSEPSEKEDCFSVDDNSPFGRILSNAAIMQNLTDAVRKYEDKMVIDSVVVRDDLICDPHRRYTSNEKFLGSICYTENNEVALAVNARNNLFIYKPWFNGNTSYEEALRAVQSPNLSKFYDVTEECKHIMQYAETVTYRPLTPAKFTFNVFSKVRDAFYSMTLSRMQLPSILGKVVVPESVLLAALESGNGESIYCIVPVGKIGSNLVVVNHEGYLETISPVPWGDDDYYYDISGVL